MQEHFLENVKSEFHRMKMLSEKAMLQISDEEFSKQLSSDSNSIQVIVQHIAGNLLSRWTDFLTTDGEKEWRNRDSEFEEQKISREDLMKRWEEGWAVLFATLEKIQPENLLQDVFIRKEALTVTQALLRQISHYSYHTGQIVQLAKEWKGSEWKTLSIPKGKSGEHQKGAYLGEQK